MTTTNTQFATNDKIESTTKDFILNELGFLLDEAKSEGVLAPECDPVGNKNITRFVLENHNELLKNITKASTAYDVVEFLNNIGYETFRIDGGRITVYVNKNNFFYADRKKV